MSLRISETSERAINECLQYLLVDISGGRRLEEIESGCHGTIGYRQEDGQRCFQSTQETCDDTARHDGIEQTCSCELKRKRIWKRKEKMRVETAQDFKEFRVVLEDAKTGT